VSPLPAERLTLLVYAALAATLALGVVLSTINGRSETRSYAKPVRGGRSDHNLSDEERAAIAMAMGATNPELASGVR
jgi:hypothetical protein